MGSVCLAWELELRVILATEGGALFSQLDLDLFIPTAADGKKRMSLVVSFPLFHQLKSKFYFYVWKIKTVAFIVYFPGHFLFPLRRQSELTFLSSVICFHLLSVIPHHLPCPIFKKLLHQNHPGVLFFSPSLHREAKMF